MKKRVIFIGLLAGLVGVGEVMAACPGTKQIQTAGTAVSEVNSVNFTGFNLPERKSVTIGRLRFSSTRALTPTQVAAAFANLKDGADSGAGTGGNYSGRLSGWSSGGVDGSLNILFTSSNTGDVSRIDVSASGSATPKVTEVIKGSTSTVTLSSLLTGNTVCVGSSGNWEAQEFHKSSGTLTDWKKGANDPVDKTSDVGTWSISGSGTGSVVSYSYTGSGPTAYTVYDNGNGSYSFCNGSTETVASKIVAGQVGC